MIFKYLPPVLLLALVALPVRAELTLLSGLSIPGGGEVVAHYNNPSGPDYILVTDSLLRTNGTSHRIQILPLTATTPLLAASGSVANFDPIFGFDATLSVSSVAADPAGRGFGVASIIPTNSIGTRGRLAFFDLSNGSILRTVEVGFHPDAVKFTPDGTKVIVANEGEFKANAAHTPGSVSVVSLTGINGVSSFSSVTPAVTTIDFNTGLATGVTLDGLRINVAGTAAADRYLHIEPEFPVATNDKAYVTLQENNAIATIDLTGASANKITAIKYLGTITQRIDASDRDPQNGGLAAININDVVPGLPMPDTLVTFMYRGRRLLATANEGDARTDDGDIARAGAADVVDTVSSGPTDVIFSGSISDSSGIGRLNISRVDGNTDDDALIEVPTMIGTRSFTLWDEAGTLVYDSGSAIEQFVRSNFPLTFNMNNGAASAIDSRSDDKGPEVEALAHGEINGRHYIFAGAERQNGVFQFDITDLNHVEIVGYYNVVDGVTVTTGTQFVSPETLVFVSAGESPTGRPLLIAGYEGVPDANINGSVAVFEVTPSAARVTNASIRTTMAANQTLITGFVAGAGSNDVLVRAVGPGLSAFGVTGVLEDPRLTLFSESAQLDTNEDWATGLSANFGAAGAFPLTTGSRDSALSRAVLGGRSHTVHLAARSAGNVLLELYNLTNPSQNALAGFTNFSGRGRVGGSGDMLIGGFVLAGSGTKTVLIRAVGPRLANFGVTDALADPRLEVYRGNLKVGENDDWTSGSSPVLAGIDITAADFTAAGAFGLDTDAKSSAVRLTLTAGAAYTVHVSGVGSASGEVLLEVYELP